jgi:hypothetical protein
MPARTLAVFQLFVIHCLPVEHSTLPHQRLSLACPLLQLCIPAAARLVQHLLRFRPQLLLLLLGCQLCQGCEEVGPACVCVGGGGQRDARQTVV